MAERFRSVTFHDVCPYTAFLFHRSRVPMPSPPPFPKGCPPCFRATVHGTVFAGRDRLLSAVKDGDHLGLRPDPPGQENPEVWVHLESGDPVGHLPSEISEWLCPWLQRG